MCTHNIIQHQAVQQLYWTHMIGCLMYSKLYSGFVSTLNCYAVFRNDNHNLVGAYILILRACINYEMRQYLQQMNEESNTHIVKMTTGVVCLNS